MTRAVVAASTVPPCQRAGERTWTHVDALHVVVNQLCTHLEQAEERSHLVNALWAGKPTTSRFN